MTRQEKEKMDQIRFLLPAEMKRKLQGICDQQGYKMSSVMRLAVKQFIDEHQPEKQKKERAQT